MRKCVSQFDFHATTKQRSDVIFCIDILREPKSSTGYFLSQKADKFGSKTQLGNYSLVKNWMTLRHNVWFQ